jgi:uncharacterized membrane protein YfcA
MIDTPGALAQATLAAAAGAAAASVTGFGLGSLLTPVLALAMPMPSAVTLTAVPHAVATALRLWRMRHAVDRGLLRSFGVASAAGGLLGAWLASRWSAKGLVVLFGVLLVASGVSGLTGWTRRVPASRTLSLVGGALSGLFGGLVGNQGGVRAAALLGARVGRDAFVATATASAMLVDIVRLPLYITRAPDLVWTEWPVVALTTAGAIVGTLAGVRLLRRIPESRFRAVVSWLVLLVGLVTLGGALR